MIEGWKYKKLEEILEQTSFHSRSNRAAEDAGKTNRLNNIGGKRNKEAFLIPQDEVHTVAQTYFANPVFQDFVNARVFLAAVSQLSSQRI